jgi:hypothetical protein
MALQLIQGPRAAIILIGDLKFKALDLGLLPNRASTSASTVAH